jgi:DNA repair protein RecO (recombination protein O)
VPGVYRDVGIALRTVKLGEADRIVTFVTQGHGKVRAVAKGVRKTKSRLGARVEPPTHVSLQLWEGRELDVVTGAEALDHFKPVRTDLDRLTRANALLEAVDAVVQEREADPRIYVMLLGALRVLSAQEAPLVVPAFYWKLLAQQGVGPVVDVCAHCGEDGDLVAFDVVEGGTLCRSCRSGTRISPDALRLLQRILGGELVAVLAEPASGAGFEVEALATTALEAHLERRLRSVRLIDRH